MRAFCYQIYSLLERFSEVRAFNQIFLRTRCFPKYGGVQTIFCLLEVFQNTAAYTSCFWGTPDFPKCWGVQTRLIECSRFSKILVFTPVFFFFRVVVELFQNTRTLIPDYCLLEVFLQIAGVFTRFSCRQRCVR